MAQQQKIKETKNKSRLAQKKQSGQKSVKAVGEKEVKQRG